jgi:hypothetical protein
MKKRAQTGDVIRERPLLSSADNSTTGMLPLSPVDRFSVLKTVGVPQNLPSRLSHGKYLAVNGY